MNPDYLRSIRKACGLSARMLAELAGGGLTRNNICDFENGRSPGLRLESARRIADVFGVNLQCLIEETFNPRAIGMAYKLRNEDDEFREDLAVLLAESIKEVQR